MHFATFAGSDFEALEPIIELEQAKREMEIGMDRQGSEDAVEGEGEVVRSVGTANWWEEGGMGVIRLLCKTPPERRHTPRNDDVLITESR